MTRDEIKRVVGYVRVSTAEQGRSGLGLEGQRSAIVAECARRGWELVGGEPYCDIVSGKSLNGRHELKRALDDLAARRADALVVAKLDRLSRSVVDFGRVLKLAQRHGWALAILDPDLDTSTATGKLMANMLISVAEWERDIIAQPTRTALAAKKAAGGYWAGSARSCLRSRFAWCACGSGDELPRDCRQADQGWGSGPNNRFLGLDHHQEGCAAPHQMRQS